ncbi:hypothetical protein AB0I28_33650 [Phytomonospora sp. NPDC050363]|uniref:WXG100 family type VII secretion target n=1 Tax=Phytomonospora sp. NPDC050363 TaxID=3155642 RepID=UPI0033E9EF70
MGSYDAMSYDELVAAFASIDPAPVRASSGSWNQAQGKTGDVGTILAKRLAALAHDWKGSAAGAFGAYMDEIGEFCAKLAEDESEMGDGMAEMAADGASYKARAEALTNPPPKNAKEKEKVRKELAKLLGELGGRYQASASKYWKTPAKAPANLPGDDDHVEDAPIDVADPYEGVPPPLEDAGPPPESAPPLPPAPVAPVPYVPEIGYDNGNFETGLAGAAPAAPAPAPVGLGMGMGAGGAPGFSPGVAVTGLSSAVTPGRAPTPAATGAGRSGGGLFGGAAPRQHAHEEDEPEGNRTWLTEDEMVWGGAEGTPAPVVDRRA